MGDYKMNEEEQERQVNEYANYGKCSICGGPLPNGYAEGVCPECEFEYPELCQ